MAPHTLYQEVVNITYEYLGPAADRFVVRQIRNHLQKDPEQLQRKDLAQLIDWIGLAMNLLSEDTKLVNQYITDLTSLTKTAKKQRNNGQAASA